MKKTIAAIFALLASIFLIQAFGQSKGFDGVNKEKNPLIEIVVEHDYLHLPMSREESDVDFKILKKNGEPIGIIKGMLTSKKADWHAEFDVSAYKGQTIFLEYQENYSILKPTIKQGDSLPVADYSDWDERPKWHMSPNYGRMGNICGLVYMDEMWHVFYEHNPYSLYQTDYKVWGHSVSKDLIKWEQRPSVLVPKIKGSGKELYSEFPNSGSVYFDKKNRSGLFASGKNGLIALYSIDGVGDVLAVMDEKSGKFQEIKINSAVIKDEGREPTLFYNEDSKLWTVIRNIGTDESPKAGIYVSQDLKKWEKTDEIEGIGANPNLVKLHIEGRAPNFAWIVMGGDSSGRVGNFDGKKFTPFSKRERRLVLGDAKSIKFWQNAPEEKTMFSMLNEIPSYAIKHSKSRFGQSMTMPWKMHLSRIVDGEIQPRAAFADEIFERMAPPKSALVLNDGAPFPYYSNNYLIPEISANNIFVSARIAVGDSTELFLEVGNFSLNYEYYTGYVDIARQFKDVHFGSVQKTLSCPWFYYWMSIDNVGVELLFGSGDLLVCFGDSIISKTPFARIGGGGGGAQVEVLMRYEGIDGENSDSTDLTPSEMFKRIMTKEE